MDAEKLRLLKQLSLLGDVVILNKSKESLVKAISEMDSAAVELILEDNKSYQDTTKTIFLEKLNAVFKEFKTKDNNLAAYPGKCNGDECPNKNKRGFSFVGNKSSQYINFIIEENEDGTVKDLYTCSHFCADDIVIDKNKERLNIRVYRDELVNFTPTPTYNYKKNKAIDALNEIKLFKDREISKEEIITWIKDYEDLYKSLNMINNLYKYHYSFYELYYHIDGIYEFLIIENEVKMGIDEFNSININNEIDLLKWLVKFENLYYKLTLLHPYIVTKESLQKGYSVLYKDYTAFFKTDIVKSCIDLEKLMATHYYEKLNKYTTQSKEEQENQMPSDYDYDYRSALKHHLEKRGIKV